MNTLWGLGKKMITKIKPDSSSHETGLSDLLDLIQTKKRENPKADVRTDHDENESDESEGPQDEELKDNNPDEIEGNNNGNEGWDIEDVVLTTKEKGEERKEESGKKTIPNTGSSKNESGKDKKDNVKEKESQSRWKMRLPFMERPKIEQTIEKVMTENKENRERKLHEKLHRNFMQMSEMESILEMERQIFEEECTKRNEELEKKRIDVQAESEALRDIIIENKALQKSIVLKRALEQDDEAITKVAQENVELREQVATLENEKTELRKNEAALENILSDHQRQISELEESLSLEEKESAKYKRLAKALKEKLEKLKVKVTSSLQEIKSNKVVTKKITDEIKRNLKADTEKIKKDMIESWRSYQGILKSNSEYKEDLKKKFLNSENQLKKSLDLKKKLESDLQKRELEITEFESSAKFMSDGLKQTLKGLDEKYEFLEKEHKNLQKSYAEQNELIKHLNKQKEDELFALKKVICSKDDVIEGLNDDIENIKSSALETQNTMEKSLRLKEKECRTLKSLLDTERLDKTSISETEAKFLREINLLKEENKQLRAAFTSGEQITTAISIIQEPILKQSPKNSGLAEGWEENEEYLSAENNQEEDPNQANYNRPDPYENYAPENVLPINSNKTEENLQVEYTEEQGWNIESEEVYTIPNIESKGVEPEEKKESNYVEIEEEQVELNKDQDKELEQKQVYNLPEDQPENLNSQEENIWNQDDILLENPVAKDHESINEVQDSEKKELEINSKELNYEEVTPMRNEEWGASEQEIEGWREPEQTKELDNLAEDEIRQSKQGFYDKNIIENRLAERFDINEDDIVNIENVVENLAQSVNVTPAPQNEELKEESPLIEEKSEDDVNNKQELDLEADSKELMEGGWEEIQDPILQNNLLQSPVGVGLYKKGSPSNSEQNSRNIHQLEEEFSKWEEEKKEVSLDVRRQEGSIDESSINAARLDIEDISKEFELSARLLSDHRLLDEEPNMRIGKKHDGNKIQRVESNKNSYSDKKRGRSSLGKYLSSRKKNDSVDGKFKSSQDGSIDDNNDDEDVGEETRNWGIDLEAEEIIYKNTLAHEGLELGDSMGHDLNELILADPLKREISEIKHDNLFKSIDFLREKLPAGSDMPDVNQVLVPSQIIKQEENIQNLEEKDSGNQECTKLNQNILVEEEFGWPSEEQEIHIEPGALKQEANLENQEFQINKQEINESNKIAILLEQTKPRETKADGGAASGEEGRTESEAEAKVEAEVRAGSEAWSIAGDKVEVRSGSEWSIGGNKAESKAESGAENRVENVNKAESGAGSKAEGKAESKAESSLDKPIDLSVEQELLINKPEVKEKDLNPMLSEKIVDKEEKKSEKASDFAQSTKGAKAKFPVGKPGLFGGGLVINKAPLTGGGLKTNPSGPIGTNSLILNNPKKNDDDIDLESILGNKYVKK